MRILTLLHDLAAGGSERAALSLAAEWRALGADSRLLLAAAEGPAAVPDGLPVTVLEGGTPRSLTSRFRLARPIRAAVEALRPEIVFLPGNWHLPLARGVALARPRPRIVAKLSNPPLPDLFPGAGPFAVRVFRALAAPLDALAFWPPALAPELRRLVPATPLAAVPNPPLALPVRPRAPLPPAHRRTLLVAGRLVPQKNLGLALDAFALAAGARELRLDIAGDGPERAALEAQVERLGLADRVRFLGQVPDLAAPLAGADLLLLSSRFEGTPAVVFEALAAGVPVVATACSPVLPLLLDRPGRGRIVETADPRALARAILAQLAEPEGVGDVDALLAPHAPGAIARRYLELFTELTVQPARRAAE